MVHSIQGSRAIPTAMSEEILSGLPGEEQLAPPPRGSIWLFIGAIAVLVGGMLGLVMLIAPRPRGSQPIAKPQVQKPLAEATLPDGGQLRLENVTYGTRHTISVPVQQ